MPPCLYFCQSPFVACRAEYRTHQEKEHETKHKYIFIYISQQQEGIYSAVIFQNRYFPSLFYLFLLSRLHSVLVFFSSFSGFSCWLVRPQIFELVTGLRFAFFARLSHFVFILFVSSLFKLVSRLLHIVFCVYCVCLV